jgi:hypothetical protein
MKCQGTRDLFEISGFTLVSQNEMHPQIHLGQALMIAVSGVFLF